MTHINDEASRRLAISERARNVLVEASAGTGKTALVVERLLALVAPEDDSPPVPIERIAAITFTRKAAGELRVRTRQRMLHVLASLPADAPRAVSLHRALAGLDTAEIGTIHSFADRLLRRWPAQARLDPRYALHDAPERLAEECFELVVHAAETGTFGEHLRGTPVEARAEEAASTILALQRAGLRLCSFDGDHWTQLGLDRLVAGFVRHRDVALADIATSDFDRATFERFADELLRLTDGLSTVTRGGQWFVDTAAILRRAVDERDPAILYHELVRRLDAGPRGRASIPPTQRADFPDDPRAWDVWKAFAGDQRKRRVREGSLRDDLLAPLRRWLAQQLVRLQPVVLHVYERVKARHQAVDHVDLLLRLRDLLRDDLAIRCEAQELFTHIFVDEFQDTDPLQAEVILYLCERGASARLWTDIVPAPGTLTLVGDPKQSIYRFRRADIAAYQRVVSLVERGPHLSVQLTASWRSAPALVDWLNARCGAVLGGSADGARFSPESGEVAYAPLTHGRDTGRAVTVHAVAFEVGVRGVDEARTLEADVMARYVRWLVEVSGLAIEDPVTRELRGIRYGDIAVLAVSTTHLRRLFDVFDRDHVPYAARGGTLFLADPLIRAFLLGLSAIADRDDGVALAALLRPPFFAVDLGDLARARPDATDDRVTSAKAIVRELRRRRFERGVGATARALLEDTALGRVVSRSPNGSQRLHGLRELCLQLESRALDEHLDFDAAVEQMRPWVTRPRQLERPHPVGDEAVRVLTIHQAKGLEFPVVVLWDACATWTERGGSNDAWMIERDGHGWALELDQLRWEHPPGRGLAKHERRMREAERKRLVYVAATRTRDLLVVPLVSPSDDDAIFGSLLGATPHPTMLVQPVHTAHAHAPWYVAATPSSAATVVTTDRDRTLRADWEARATAAAQGVLRPLAFTDAKAPRVFWGRTGRFGLAFGSTVHQAIGLALAGATPAEAVMHAATAVGLRRHVDEAIEDVRRALVALSTIGVAPEAGQYRLEYPVAGASPRGDLLAGYVDLVATTAAGPILLDFKTDAAVGAVPDAYIEQVRGYARVVAGGLGLAHLRAGLLFTSDGSIHWLSSTLDGER